MTGAGSADVDVDLGRLFGSLARNWKRIVAVSVGVTAVAFMFASMATPHYRAETRILIENRESVYARPTTGASEADRPLLDSEAVASQVEVISSNDILREVARKLKLASHDEFGARGETSAIGNLLILTGLKSDPSQASVEDRVIRAMRERLNVYNVDRSRVIVVSFSSTDPKLAADVPNAIADAYLAVQEQAKRLTTADATEWLEPEIADLRKRVREAEARVADYRAKADLLAGGQNNTVIANQQLSEISSELVRVSAARSAAQARAKTIRDALASGASAESIPEVLNAPVIQRLRERQAQLSSDLADASTTLLENHPRIRSLKAQLAEVEQQIRSEARKVLASVESEASSMRARETELTGDLNRLKAAAAQAGGDEVELRALEREAAAERALLESYLTRYREAASRADRNYLPADARIFSRATQPYEPYFPKVLPITAAAFVGSALLLAIFTLLAELFSGRAMRPAPRVIEPVEEIVMPALSVANVEGAADADEAEEVVEDPIEEIRAQRAELTIEEAADRLVESNVSRAVFISPEGDEAAAASVLVAREVSDAGLRVVFLDLTSTGTPSATMLESNRYPGITNLLAAEAQFSEIIRADLYSDCHVISVGTAQMEKAMRAIDRLPIILASLETAYDLIIVECGPTDAESLSRVVTDTTEILVSVIEAEDEAIRETSLDLAESGYREVLRVTPVGYRQPPAPEGRRSVA
ncbi:MULTISPECIES: exopolysaccharide transport family protein [unclassified Aminobacter]|uniref:GumC family protein n=1 Tax=unclassified Aminobacter TaxID=2644704 RepID=UPI000467B304|nr:MULTISPECIES: exopolysaccharide transport family protein [unclassified Aminobacter]TWH35625.1 exopolysaccharide transport family protein [Aminobacter sp. J15]